jgi:hypothetical protein
MRLIKRKTCRVKGNMILKWCGIDHRIIERAAERNRDKYGALALGTDIPIVSDE